MIGRCVANRPYMYLPLKGDTNDYSVNAQNPTNTGVTTTTGQFGESNGAYEWNSGTGDYLEWSSSIGNTIAGYINNNATFILFAYATAFAEISGVFFNQWLQTGNQRSWGFGWADYDVAECSWLTFSANGATSLVSQGSANSFTTGSWDFYSLQIDTLVCDYKKNGSTFNSYTIPSSIKTNSSGDTRLGRSDNTGSPYGFEGYIHTARIYDVTLSDGALKILNNEKGRIRA